MSKEELEAALVEQYRNLYSAIITVFDCDWCHTKYCIQEGLLIADNGTFLDPMVDDEQNNWANRVQFLNAFRQIRSISLKLRDLDPKNALICEEFSIVESDE